MSYYKTPEKYRQRIHFVRPRFKSNIENVLLYLANACCRINICSCEEYNEQLSKAIRLFPGNFDASEKTIANWRTETPALFSFYKENKVSNVTRTSRMAEFLNENQDLTQFFKLFLFTFQFPGGHLKPNENIELIKKGVRFKPAQLIINVCLAGNTIYTENEIDKNFSLTAEEVTYCLFDDIRVTSGKRTPRDVAETIVRNRKLKKRYYDVNDPFIFSSSGAVRSKGDVTRYAADILDYMVIASLMEKNPYGYYSLKSGENNPIKIFSEDTNFFQEYDKFYFSKTEISSAEISAIEPLWYEYVDEQMKPDVFKTNVAQFISSDSKIAELIKERILWLLENASVTKKDTGNVGESIVEGHEKTRLDRAGYPELSKRVQIVDSPSYHPGFDIDSFEGDEEQLHRYIEVKTTISKSKILQYDFHMSTNEWSVANTHREHYCVYRLMLSEKDMKLYILRNPVGLYKTDQIEAVPRDGMEIHFKEENFTTTEILI